MTDAALPTVTRAHKWPRDPNDFYIEPEWCSHRLFDHVRFQGRITDPSCGMGRIVNAAAAAGYQAEGFDKVDRGYGHGVRDFMETDAYYENIVSNPPYSISDAYVARALERTQFAVVVLLPLTWMSGGRRSRWLESQPLSCVWVLTPRPSLPPGEAILAGGKIGSGTTDFAWFGFIRGHTRPPVLSWIHRDGGDARRGK